VECEEWPAWVALSKGRELQGVCRSMLEFLKTVDENETFAAPLPVDEIPGYAEMIPEPMDLSTMADKVERSGGSARNNRGGSCYASLSEFRRDLRLVICNCLTFNEEDSPYVDDARQLAAAVQGAYEAATGHLVNGNGTVEDDDDDDDDEEEEEDHRRGAPQRRTKRARR